MPSWVEYQADSALRVTLHTREVSFSSRFTFLPTTHSSHQRSTSPPESITPISTPTDRFAQIFFAINGHLPSPSPKVYLLTTFARHSANQKSSPLHLLYADRPKPRRSSCSRDCPRIQDRPSQIRGDRTGVDSEVCHLGVIVDGLHLLFFRVYGFIWRHLKQLGPQCFLTDDRRRYYGTGGGGGMDLPCLSCKAGEPFLLAQLARISYLIGKTQPGEWEK